ncbi:hypothetical protein ACNOYE_18410 [Nannocystaceae bacterium ST9]
MTKSVLARAASTDAMDSAIEPMTARARAALDGSRTGTHGRVESIMTAMVPVLASASLSSR